MENLLSNISDFSKKRFAEIPFPHRKDEFWRFGDLKSWGVDALFPFFQHHCQRKLKDAKIEVSYEVRNHNGIIINHANSVTIKK